MCNRFRMSAKDAELARKFGVDISPERGKLPPPELFPKYNAWVIRKDGGTRILDVMSWGVPLNGKPITNVRNLKSGFWRNMLSNPERRCLVPVTEFCEWSGEKGSKTEHWFSVGEQPIFAFAGIWRPTEVGNAFAFLTCEPNPLVAPIHEKAMPVILDEADYDRWLDGDVDEVCSLATPFPSQLMKVA
jgi:putative SOS response-associated peptidase YedK